MRKKFLQSKKGLTLVELLIYISITMIILVVIIDLVTRVAQVKTQSSGQEIILENARFLNDRLTYAISGASTIDGSYPSDNLSLTVGGVSLSFTFSDGKIFYQEGGGAIVPLSNGRVEIRPPEGESIFTKVANGSSESIEIKYRVVNRQTSIEKAFQTTVFKRGK